MRICTTPSAGTSMRGSLAPDRLTRESAAGAGAICCLPDSGTPLVARQFSQGVAPRMGADAETTMAEQIPLQPELRADDPHVDARRDDGTREVASDLAYRRLGIVNVCFFGRPRTAGWVLI